MSECLITKASQVGLLSHPFAHSYATQTSLLDVIQGQIQDFPDERQNFPKNTIKFNDEEN